jgi:hypothetical protein
MPKQLNPYNEPWMLLNATLIAEYVKYSAACVVQHGIDGMTLTSAGLGYIMGGLIFARKGHLPCRITVILSIVNLTVTRHTQSQSHAHAGMTLDIENMPWPRTPNGTTNSTTDAVRSGLTDLTCALKAALTDAIPGSVLTFTTDGDAASSAAGYDYAALSVCCDFFMPMVYSSCNNTIMSDADEKGPIGWEADRCENTAGGNSLSTVRKTPLRVSSAVSSHLVLDLHDLYVMVFHCACNRLRGSRG